MMHGSGPEAGQDDVLIALALRGPLSVADAALACGAPAHGVERALHELGREALVEPRDLPAGSFALTPAGRARAARAIAHERDDLCAAVASLYPTFDPLNQCVKELLRSWQLRTVGGREVPNDHSDAAYDARLVAQLAELHREAAAMLTSLTSLRERYASYARRLAAAVERARRGEQAFVSGLAVDSFHSVWWQLHADLLAMLDRRRSDRDG
jgi:hypothetical protein